MDWTIVYPGSLPQDIDILQPQRNAMVALGFALGATFGTNTLVSGLAATPTAPASMSVTVGSGGIIFSSVVDANAYGSLAANSTNNLVKMGISQQPTTLGPFAAPGTAGQSQNFLIQAAFSETDGTPVTLPYFNASNTSQPFSGPSGSNTSQNTTRTQTVILQVKAGAAATTGSQTTPAPDTGFTGLWVVTVANGQTSIVAANIAQYPGSPIIPAVLDPGMVPGFSNIAKFSAAGSFTFTVPSGIKKVKATVVGGGASGIGTTPAGTTSTTISLGGGGNAGTLRIGIYAVTPGQTIAVTVGAGGGWNIGTGLSGGGGTSSFGALLSAPGGTGGFANSPANSALTHLPCRSS
jgi:hypothetical protein